MLQYGNYWTLLQVNNNLEKQRKITIYKKDNEEIGIIQSVKTKIAFLNKNIIGSSVQVVNPFYMIDSPIQKSYQKYQPINVAERHYEFDVVKDEDISKPDISDCEIQ